MSKKIKIALVKDVNLIVATTNNYPAICILNKVEMAFRAYNPCFGCATHYAVGRCRLQLKFSMLRSNLSVA